MARNRSIIPALPLPRRALPWVLFVLGFLSIGFGAFTGEITGLAIGVIAMAGAIISWVTGALLNYSGPNREEPTDDGQ